MNKRNKENTPSSQEIFFAVVKKTGVGTTPWAAPFYGPTQVSYAILEEGVMHG